MQDIFFNHARTIAIDAVKSGTSVCIICANEKKAKRFVKTLELLCSKTKSIAYLPSPQTLLYEKIEPSPSVTAKRLEVLLAWEKKQIDIIVMSIATYSRPMANTKFIGQHCLKFTKNDVIEPSELRKQLIAWGYDYADYVCDPGTFAIRGSIIDLFPFNRDQAYRIELFDNIIDNIYAVTNEQVTGIESISLFPAREYSLNDDTIHNFANAWQKNFGLWGQKSEIYQRTVAKKIYSGIHEWLAWLYDSDCYWDSYRTAEATYVDPEFKNTYFEQLSWAEKYFSNNKSNAHEPILPTKFMVQSLDRLQASKPWPAVKSKSSLRGKLKLFTSRYNAESDAHSNSGRFIACDGDLLTWLSKNPSGYYTMQSCIEVSEMVSGILIESVNTTTKIRKTKPRTESFNVNLALGSYVVHNKYGIGRLSKIEVIEHAGEKYDCLVIEYANQGKVIIPTTELDQISKFKTISSDDIKLSELGKKSWKKKQEKVIKAIQDDAVQLMQLHAHRKSQKRPVYRFNQEAFSQFLNRFPFEDTKDQKHITATLVQDLVEKDYPMDRLVCGDVGFGKTEIALRACWLAVSNGKQAIWLAPTTVLARQHAMRLRERYLDDCFNIIECIGGKKLSESNQLALEHGQIDILVGTHGVLNSSLKFGSLGLIIIDEEHKFGVKQKDAILAKYPAIDILSLSATPIPRSLNMAMSSLRDISLLASAPPERLDVKTITGLINDEELIKQAIFREAQRGGQIYFCYNRIDKLAEIGKQLQSWFPKIQIGIVHGKMHRNEISEIMQSFSIQKLDILLCSSIVESGIDYANANTLIVYRADLFGLSQLHQLRGRVGRGKQQAYAYLLLPDKEFQTKDCQNRIQAIEANSKLGSGFALAVEDLEIRGAGNLLGKQQSGHILDIGFQHYVKLLSQTMKWLESNPGKLVDIEALLSNKEFSYSLPYSIMIPDDYIVDPNERLKCYQELGECKEHEAIDKVSSMWCNKYGKYPEETKNLIDLAHIKLALTAHGGTRIQLYESELELTFNSGAISSHQIQKIASMPHKYILKPPAQVAMNYSGKTDLRLLVSEFCTILN